MDLSIIIPTYNEARKIAVDIGKLSDYLSKNKISAEIIISDDGSSDDTVAVAKSCNVANDIKLTVLATKKNSGKGFAIKQGVASANGNVVMYCDAGNCTPYQMIKKGMALLNSNDCDIAHASRKLTQSNITRQPTWYRRIVSKFFFTFVVQFMHLPNHLTDTQCGFKLYKKNVAKTLYQSLVTYGFTYDIEIIMRANAANHHIKEFPIEWASDADSRVKPLRLLTTTLTSLIKIKKMNFNTNTNMN